MKQYPKQRRLKKHKILTAIQVRRLWDFWMSEPKPF